MPEERDKSSNYGDIMVPHCALIITRIVAPFITHVPGFGFWVLGFGFWVLGFGFRGSGFGVRGSGFGV